MTLVADLVEVSSRVASTSLRSAKIRELASTLRTLEPSEIEIAVHYLSGEIPQGKIGVQYTTVLTAAQGRTGSAGDAHAGRARCAFDADRQHARHRLRGKTIGSAA
jgi:hypothetical protein